MKHLFILNPAAGKGRAAALEETVRRVCREKGAEFQIARTECAGDAVRLARSGVETGEPCRIYACGGDGTLNEVVQAAAGHDHAAVTNVPMGTGNDFLKMFGPDHRSAFSDIAALMDGPQKALDLIDCGGRLGLDIVAAGVDARVADDVGKYKALPLVKGAGAYVMSLAANVLFKGISRPMRVEMDGKVWDEPVAVLCICNGRYYGGGFCPVPEAQPDDGILDVLLVPSVSLLTFARLVGDYSKGLYRKHPEHIIHYHGPGPITFSAAEPVTTVVDGEIIRAKSYTARLSDKKVNFFYPEGVPLWPMPEEIGQNSQ